MANTTDYRGELANSYYSTHYESYMPKTPEAWNWVLERIELNFGSVFSSIPKDSAILDVGCGVGYLEHYLLKKGFTNIHALDMSQEQLDIARLTLQTRGLEYGDKVQFETADVFSHLRISRRYDLIAIIDCIEHFSKNEILELLKLVRCALCDGGYLLIRTPNAENIMFGRFYNDLTHETPFTRRSLEQVLKATGIHVAEVEFEKSPVIRGAGSVARGLKRFVRLSGRRVLGKFLDIPSSAFSGDIIAVGNK